MYEKNFINHLVYVTNGVAMPLVRTFGDIFLNWGSEILHTFPELRRTHEHFYHAKPKRLYALILRDKDKQATHKTLTQPEDVTESCDFYQRLSKEPSRLREAMP